MMFPAFWKLRRDDPDRVRPYKVKGNKLIIDLITWIPEVLLFATVLLSVLPLNGSKAEIDAKMPVLIGTIITLAVGEILVRMAEKGKKESETLTSKRQEVK